MLNKKFLTKLLDDGFRKTIMDRNHKFIESKDLKLKQYATYVVDRYFNDRDQSFIELKEANYGFSPLEILAYVAKDGSIKKYFFEFNIVAHFLKENNHSKAVEVAICMLSELAKENKKDVSCFDIDKIDAYLKKLEAEYVKQQEQKAREEAELAAKLEKEEQEKENKNDYKNEMNEIEDSISGHKILKHNDDYSAFTQFL